jgi:hypothetical protein
VPVHSRSDMAGRSWKQARHRIATIHSRGVASPHPDTFLARLLASDSFFLASDPAHCLAVVEIANSLATEWAPQEAEGLRQETQRSCVASC